MRRRLAFLSLLSAWLCASGAMLDVAQVFAWTRMFASYSRTESVIAAAGETFDPGKPCEICRAVSKARDACDRHGPTVSPAAADKIIMISERAVPFVGAPLPRLWPEIRSSCAPMRRGDVPVPPPRFALA
jgi:hypothetical protein